MDNIYNVDNTNKPYIVCTIVIILIILFLPIFIYLIYTKSPTITKVKENYSNELFDHINEGKGNYSWDQLRVGKRAIDCYKLKGKDCLKYSNCGYCVKDGNLQCIPGDEQGPLFKEDCQGWIYTNYYDDAIFGEKITTITPPWSMFYSDYEARYPSPTSRSALV